MKCFTDIKTVFSIDVRALAIFRILMGLILLLDIINRIKLTPAFNSDTGILPRHMVDLGAFEYAYHFQIMFVNGGEWFSYLYFSLMLLLGVMLLIGYKTKLITILCWLFFCSIIVRDPLTRHAGDILFIVLLFWSIFLPLGKVYSFDAIINRDSNITLQNKIYFSAGTAAILVQVFLVFFTTGLFKANHQTWIDGTHLYYTLSRFDYVKPLAFLVYPHYEFLKFLTKSSLIIELFAPLLFFMPFLFKWMRMISFLLLSGLMLGIGLTMDVGLFPIIAITGLILIIPKHFWDKFELIGKNIGFDKLEFFLNRLPKRSFGKKHNSLQISLGSSFVKLREYTVALLCAYVIFWNIGEVWNRYELNESAKLPGYFLKLDQRWSMFANRALNSEILSVLVTFDDGIQKDLMDELKIKHNSSDQFDHFGYQNYRWRIFFSNKLRSGDYENYRSYFVEFMINNYLPENYSIQKINEAKLIGSWFQIGELYKHSERELSILYIH
jgi:hypothetical protein